MVPDLTFRQHIINICAKSFRSMGFILSTNFRNNFIVKIIYHALVRSHLETNALPSRTSAWGTRVALRRGARESHSGVGHASRTPAWGTRVALRRGARESHSGVEHASRTPAWGPLVALRRGAR
ncbi:Transcription elongation factor SPT5 [Operophtera brumata]|uniref:Transcription elongation factor SPT5 n=1 Tax=Operophtera brumata TaxID=104452 RepID=A0A0L7LDL0_OPEBR|nr:Transcription elongation factor SPT5 [Operophtera brumata]